MNRSSKSIISNNSIENKANLYRKSEIELSPVNLLEIINKVLSLYPVVDQLLSSEMMEGFQSAANDVEDYRTTLNDIDTIDEAYNMLNDGLIKLPSLECSQFDVIAVTIAKFLVKEFHCLTPSFIRQFNCITNLDFIINL